MQVRILSGVPFPSIRLTAVYRPLKPGVLVQIQVEGPDMAETKAKLKKGMGGSRNGKSRWTGTEDLKRSSKKRRRREGKEEIKQVSPCGVMDLA